MADTSASGGALDSAQHVLLDTNVVLDWILDHKPWSDQAQPLWQARNQRRITCYIPASVFTDIFYILRKQVGITAAFDGIDLCFSAFNVVPVDGAILQLARTLAGNDFEDNVQLACAYSAGLALIVTRNGRHFTHAQIPVIEPADIEQHLP